MGGEGLELLITIFIILPLRVCFVSKSQKRSSKKTYRDLQYLCVRFSTVPYCQDSEYENVFADLPRFLSCRLALFLSSVFFFYFAFLSFFLSQAMQSYSYSLTLLFIFLSPLSPPPFFLTFLESISLLCPGIFIA